jgi:hypothetical protein
VRRIWRPRCDLCIYSLNRLLIVCSGVQMEDMTQERVAQKEKEMHATYDERIRNFEERCVLS